MSFPVKVVKYQPDPHRRILVISDIHGNLPFLKGLLAQLAFTPEDILILLGDLLEKGLESLNLLDYVMELEKTHTVLSLQGNCDGLLCRFFENDQLDEVFFQKYLENNPQSTIRQMGDRINLPFDGDLPALRRELCRHYPHIYQWVDNLPTIIDTPQYCFVHGGVPSLEGMDQLDAWECMKNDYFYEKDLSFPKYLVVGHCPTTLYHLDFQDASPIVDHQRKIISIDGGCVLKLDGQLNGLILEESGISWQSYDGLPQVRALEAQNPSENPLNIRWGHSEIKVLKQEEEFSLCQHLESQRTLPILTKFICSTPPTAHCQDSTDYLLPVQPGDVLSMSQQVSGGILAKKDGVTGWYWGKYEKI